MSIYNFKNSRKIILGFILLVIIWSCEQYSSFNSDIVFTISQDQLPEYESQIDHAGLIGVLDAQSYARGRELYTTICYNCHGDTEHEGSLPTAHKFWQDPFTAKNDPYTMYQVVTRGFGTMPPQVQLSPQQKYDVIHYLREEFIKKEVGRENRRRNPRTAI